MKNDQEHYINDKMDEHAKNFEHWQLENMKMYTSFWNLGFSNLTARRLQISELRKNCREEESENWNEWRKQKEM